MAGKVQGVVKVHEELCKQCGLCISVCPKGILAFSKTKINAKGYRPVELTNPEECIGCAFCALMCPEGALEVYMKLPTA